jgi:hypothetical protein
MARHGPNERNLDPGIRAVLEELRDLRVEMRADRQRTHEERRKADEERRQERLRSDERFERVMRETQRAFRDVRSVGLSIVKTLNHHTRILQRIERKLIAPGHWRPGHGNGRGGGAQR